jgi:membrane-bound lytic murein transglycosylase B
MPHNACVRMVAPLLAALLLTTPILAQQEAPPAPTDVNAPVPFDVWLEGVTAEARERGFSDTLVDSTLAGLQPLTRVIASDRSQAELVVGFNRYLQSHVTTAMVRRGRLVARQNRTLLTRIEAKYDVQRRFLLSIWGMETRYGAVTGRTPVFQALATLAWEGRRADFFKDELFNALTMVSKGYIDAPTMTGSWAGAMGQPQFMPSSYLKYAEDFNKDGRRDIWKSTGDALASIANYLKEFGWDDDETWGREVRVTAAVRARVKEQIPQRTEGCYAKRNMTERKPLTEWQKLGVRLKNGQPLPRSSIKAGLVETDERSFLVYDNYDAILEYNCAHYYALTVAMLSDQLK